MELGFQAPTPQSSSTDCPGHFLLSAYYHSSSNSPRSVSEEDHRTKQLEAEHTKAKDGHREQVKETQENVDRAITVFTPVYQGYCAVSPALSELPLLFDLHSTSQVLAMQ